MRKPGEGGIAENGVMLKKITIVRISGGPSVCQALC